MTDPLAVKSVDLAKAIRAVESGGDYDVAGGSGEYGAFQFMPATWRSASSTYLGVPDAPMTKENQNKAAVKKIHDLLKKGYNERQVALVWNGGQPVEKKGVNKYGIKYDTAAYADKVIAKYKEETKGRMPMPDFWQRVDAARKLQKTDTEILDDLSRRNANLGNALNKLRTKASQTDRSDREVLNYFSQKLSGKMPTLASIPVKGSAERPFTDAELDEYSREEFRPFFPADAAGGYKEALKTVGNVPSSAWHFAKDVIKGFNPVTNIRKAVEAAAEFGGGFAESRIAGEDVSAIDVIKEMPPLLYQSVVPEFFKKMIAGDTEGAQRALVNNPVGNLAPVILVSRYSARKIGKGAQFDAALDKLASPVTKGIPNIAKAGIKAGMKRAAAPYQGKIQNSLVESTKHILNPTGRQQTAEVLGGKNTPEFLVKEGIRLSVKDGRLESKPAIDQLKETARVENGIFKELLKSEQKYRTFDDMEAAVRKSVKTIGSEEVISKNYLAREFSNFRRQFASRSIADAKGRQSLPLDAVNEIKQYFWGKEKQFGVPNAKLFNNVNYSAGRAIADMIETSVTDISAKAFNARLGEIAAAQHLLWLRNGMVVQGGLMNRYFMRVIGGMAAAQGGPFTTILGALTADRLVMFLKDAQISMNAKATILQELRGYKEGAAVVRAAEKLMKSRAEEAFARPRLPAPSYIPMGPRTPGESSVKGVPAEVQAMIPERQLPSARFIPGVERGYTSSEILGFVKRLSDIGLRPRKK